MLKNLSSKHEKFLLKNKQHPHLNNLSLYRQNGLIQQLPQTEVHGNHGKHGVQGFHATEFRLEAGCIHGTKDQLRINLKSGSGQKGQHGSHGKDGTDGARIPDSEKLTPRYNTCKNFCSCSKSLCWHRKPDQRHEYGEDCTPDKVVYQGTDGGDGGNGGDGGKAGNPGTDLNLIV